MLKSPHCGRIDFNDCPSIILFGDADRNNRSEVSIIWPKDWQGLTVTWKDVASAEERQNPPATRIRLNLNRGAATCARDLERRLITTARHWHRRLQALIETNDAYARAAFLTASAMAGAKKVNQHGLTASFWTRETADVVVSVCDDRTVVDFRGALHGMTVHQASRILEILEEGREGA